MTDPKQSEPSAPDSSPESDAAQLGDFTALLATWARLRMMVAMGIDCGDQLEKTRQLLIARGFDPEGAMPAEMPPEEEPPPAPIDDTEEKAIMAEHQAELDVAESELREELAKVGINPDEFMAQMDTGFPPPPSATEGVLASLGIGGVAAATSTAALSEEAIFSQARVEFEQTENALREELAKAGLNPDKVMSDIEEEPEEEDPPSGGDEEEEEDPKAPLNKTLKEFEDTESQLREELSKLGMDVDKFMSDLSGV